MFQKQESQLINYESDGVTSAVDYLLTRVSFGKTENTKQILGRDCIRQRQLLTKVFKFVSVTDKTLSKNKKVWKLENDKCECFFAEKFKVP